MKGTPQQPDPNRPGLSIPIKVNFHPPVMDENIEEPEVPEKGRQIRRMKITAEILQKNGCTDGCDGCRYKHAGLREARPRNPGWRERKEKAMA